MPRRLQLRLPPQGTNRPTPRYDRVFGPNHERLSSLIKLHILASDSSFNSDIFWTDDGKSFAIDRVAYQRNIMNVFYDQSKFKSLQNLLSRYRFKAVQTINEKI
jgi:hypothetical protein